MFFFSKNFDKYTFYLNRDFIYKTKRKSSFDVMNFNKFIVIQKSLKTDNIINVLSSFILLFDQYPYIMRISRSNDNKIKGLILGLKCQITVLDFFSILFRLKNEIFINIDNNISDKQQFVNIFFKNNNFDEFLLLYEKYQNLLDISINFYFNNCYTLDEKKLLVSSLDSI